MFKRVVGFVLFVGCGVLSSFVQSEEDTIFLAVGQSTLLDTESVTRVVIGDGGLLEAKMIEGYGILLLAKKTGKTNIQYWAGGERSNVLVTVTPIDVQQTASVLRAAFSAIPNLLVEQVDRHIIVTGQAITTNDFLLVKALTSEYEGVINHFLAPTLETENMVLLDVKVVEIKRNSLKELGVQWGSTVQGPSFGYIGGNEAVDAVGESMGRFFSIHTEISSYIRMLEQSGLARMLAEPKLVAKSGSHAEFIAGGEVPIPVQTEKELSIEFKKYGVILNVAPVADQYGFIDARVQVEVSTVDVAVASMGVPGFLTRKTDTHMHVRSGETIVLSGLLSHEQSKAVQKLPVLGSIPILGSLFKSKSFRNAETELVVLVTPTVLDRNEINSQDNAELLLRKYGDIEKELTYRIFD